MKRQNLCMLACLWLCLSSAACSSKKGAADGDVAGGTDNATDSNGNGGNGNNGLGTVTPGLDANNQPVVPLEPAPVPVCTDSGGNVITVTVTTQTGPNGFAAPIPITQNLYSMGVHDQGASRQDYVPNPNATYVAYLKGLKPGKLRFPAGVWGQRYVWQGNGSFNMTPALIDQFIALCRAVEAEPYLAVNIETTGIADATAMITYANKTKNYGVKWWQIGNEPNLPGEYPQESLTTYPAKYLQWRKALLAVDPTIKTVGLESYTGMAIYPKGGNPASFAATGEVDAFTPFLQGGVNNQVDAVAWHYYPLYSGEEDRRPNCNAGGSSSSSPSVDHLLQEDAQDWPPAAINFADKIMPYMRNKMQSVIPNSEIWIDEYAEDSGNCLAARGYGDRVVGALWAADSMARYAEQGVDGIFHFIYKTLGNSIDFGYTLLDEANEPRPEYYAIWMMSNLWGDRVVKTASDQKLTYYSAARYDIGAHAAVRQADGSLRVMLINKSSKDQNIRLNLADYKPVRAKQYNLIGASMTDPNMLLNGGTLSEANVTKGEAAVNAAVAQACTSNVVTIKPFSINMFIFTAK